MLTIEFRTRREGMTAAERTSVMRYFERALPYTGFEVSFKYKSADAGIFIAGRSGRESHNTKIASDAARDLSDLCWLAFR